MLLVPTKEAANTNFIPSFTRENEHRPNLPIQRMSRILRGTTRAGTMAVFMMFALLATATSSFGTDHSRSYRSRASRASMSTVPFLPRTLLTPRGGGESLNDRNGKAPFSLSMSSSSSSSSSASTAPAVTMVSTENLSLLSERGRAAVERLIAFDTQGGTPHQRHVYGDWPPPGTEDEGKKQLAEQVSKSISFSTIPPPHFRLYLLRDF